MGLHSFKQVRFPPFSLHTKYCSFCKKSVNRKSSVVQTTSFTWQNFLICHQTSKMLLRKFGLQFFCHSRYMKKFLVSQMQGRLQRQKIGHNKIKIQIFRTKLYFFCHSVDMAWFKLNITCYSLFWRQTVPHLLHLSWRLSCLSTCLSFPPHQLCVSQKCF